MRKFNKKGFTIVELVIVIAVIAILAGVLIPTFSGIVEKANDSKALQQATNAYKEAYAEAISDGAITTADNANNKNVVGSFTFTWTDDGKCSAIACTEFTGYSFSIDNNGKLVVTPPAR